VPKPTYDELAAPLAAQAAEIERLKARFADLESRLGGKFTEFVEATELGWPGETSPKSLRRASASGRKPGGQAGRQGRSLSQVSNPDEVLRLEPVCRRGCGRGLRQAAEAGVERRQVFAVPPITVRVTGLQLVAKKCACGTITRSDIPDGVVAPVQYGPRMKLRGHLILIRGDLSVSYGT
jgi:transposase